tara:strand:- start:2155 stop:2379 length:225 start_codon:yes stop_codon:yes gene_type:complete
LETNINAQPKNKPIKKNPKDKTQVGRIILKSNGQSVIKVKFELDKVNIEKNNSVGIVSTKIKILLIIFINYFIS